MTREARKSPGGTCPGGAGVPGAGDRAVGHRPGSRPGGVPLPRTSWRKWVSLLFRYGTWPRRSARAPRTSARAARLRLMNEVSLRADPVTPDTPGQVQRPGHAVRMCDKVFNNVLERARKSKTGTSQGACAAWGAHRPGRPPVRLTRNRWARAAENSTAWGFSRLGAVVRPRPRRDGREDSRREQCPAPTARASRWPQRGACPALTHTLAACQVHELKLGVHLLRRSLGPQGPRPGSAPRRAPPAPLGPWPVGLLLSCTGVTRT